jgi:outer membrane protein TolC
MIVTSARPGAVLRILLIGGLAACANPSPHPLRPEDITARVAQRAVSDEELRHALILVDPVPLGLVGGVDAALADPSLDAFWHARALAFEPTVRQARRRLLAARATARTAGFPGPLDADAGVRDMGDGDLEKDVGATLDLLGLLGLGPAAADRELAMAATDLASGELETHARTALFAVDRARLRLAAARERRRRLADHLVEAQAGSRRLELLFDRGRLGDGLIGRARAVVATLAAEERQLSRATARAAEDLAQSAGTTPDDPALAIPASLAISDTAPADDAAPVDAPAPERLLDLLPDLRTARLTYAVAEARLRAAVAAQWPQIRIGPSLRVVPDMLLPGGSVSVQVPWPGSLEGVIDAAVEEREAAREAVEDALARSLAVEDARRLERTLAWEVFFDHARPAAEGSAAAWRSARGRLDVEEGIEVVETWLESLMVRSRGVNALVDAAEAGLMADLDWREAAGRNPGLGERIAR